MFDINNKTFSFTSTNVERNEIYTCWFYRFIKRVCVTVPYFILNGLSDTTELSFNWWW